MFTFDPFDYETQWVRYHGTLWDLLIKAGWFTVHVENNQALMAREG